MIFSRKCYVITARKKKTKKNGVDISILAANNKSTGLKVVSKKRNIIK